MIFHLCIGADIDRENLSRDHFIICLPGEKLPSGCEGIECGTLAEANFGMRLRFSNPRDTVSKLPFLEVLRGRTEHAGVRDEWERALLWRANQIIDELGNDPLDAWMGICNMYRLWKALPCAGSSDSLRNRHADEPAVCVGAGPTAEDHLAEVAENRSYLRVFATDVMVNACLKHGFEPDYICSIERIQGTSNVFRSFPVLEQSVLLCPPMIPSDCAEKVKRAIFWLSGDAYANWLSQYKHRELNPGPSCGTLSITAAMECGCGPIYLIGHDLSYLDGKSHSASSHAECQAHAAAYRDPGTTWWKQEHDAIDCFGQQCKTTGLWQSFQRSIEDEIILRDYRQREILNVRRRGGLPISGTRVVPFVETHKTKLAPVEVVPWSGRRRIMWRSAVREEFATASQKCARVHDDLLAGRISPEKAAESAMISVLFSRGNIPLANYLLQQIYNSAHFHSARGAPLWWNIRRTMKSLACHTAKHVQLTEDWQDD
jgi:hypothetical protein